jgi:hypothetical protein
MQRLAFHHIPKTAGTSIRNWMNAAVGVENVFWHGRHIGADGNLLDVAKNKGVAYFDRFLVIGGENGGAKVGHGSGGMILLRAAQ